MYNDKIRLAVKVALATYRPILVRGASGWGKSSLARSAANYLGRKYREKVVSSRTQVRDLLYDADVLRRLNDARGENATELPWENYIRPEALWWAIDAESATTQLARYSGGKSDVKEQSVDASDWAKGAVVLIDEIDKADPDVPNGLLVPLGSFQFRVEEQDDRLIKLEKQPPPLVFITTNEERELPPAFLRRCVELNLPAIDADPDGKIRRELLVNIGKAHFEGLLSDSDINKIADKLVPAAAQPTVAKERQIPSPAEFIDTLQAVWQLKIDPGSTTFDEVARITVWKHQL